MNRRRALKILGLLAGASVAGRYLLLPPSRSKVLETAQSRALQLFASFDADTRRIACVEYDHPLRQYHNRGVAGGGINGFHLGWEQRRVLTDLLYAGLSEAGRERVPNEFFTSWPGIHVMNVLFCGDPRTPPYQLIITGPHLNLRLGGPNREGVAFGGPQVYGDQRGNERKGLPGNLYRYQFLTAHRLFQSLNAAQQRAAVLEVSPIQTQIELRGSKESFPGVPIAGLSAESKTIARALIDGILETYPEDDVEYAERCLQHNGGLEGLWLSYYREGEVDRSGEFQIFRLEGPAAVFYFRGYPHVHAFINVAMNSEAPLSVGEELGVNPRVLEGAAVQRLFEDAMREQTSADEAHYHPQAVVGRLRAGLIRSGDIYNLESWQDTIVVGELAESGRTRTIATTKAYANDERFAKLAGRREEILLRDATIGYLKKRGFPA